MKKNISTRHLNNLPDIDNLKKICQSIATLDAILCPEWEFRYYSFDTKWSPNEMMGSMRDGEGNEILILFNEYGACINGFAHESLMSPWVKNPPEVWLGNTDDIPDEFINFLMTEPIPSIGTTFCIWKKYSDLNWNIGNISFPDDDYRDGSEHLLFLYDDNPNTYKEWAEEYYETAVPLDIVKEIYIHKPLKDIDIKTLNPDFDLEKITKDFEDIGYPLK